MLLAAAIAALALPPLSSTAVGPDTTALRNAVTVAGVMEHELALQAIADANGGTRASGTPGYAASVDYVSTLLTDAGYDVTIQNFTYDQFVLNSSAFQRISPDPKTYVEGLDAEYSPMDYSGAGDFTAPLALAGGITIPSPGGSTSGCAAADFAGFPAGAIALVQRGTCTFREKATNAQAAGAVAVVIFNEGNDDPNDDRIGVIAGTLDPPQMTLPVIGTSFAVGEELYNRVTGGQTVTVRVAVDAETITTATANVLADTPTGREDRTVLVGAHLDSVGDGPGINDNGSGTSTILETALQMAELDIQPVNRVRFAFWGAEEDGLIGSQHYVDTLPKRDLKDIMLNLNFDMVGSPELRPLRLRRRRLGVRDGRPERLRPRSSRRLRRLLRVAGPRDRADRVRRAVGLRRVHQRGHPCRRALHRRGGHQDRRAGRRSTAVPPASRTTGATTRRATRSRTST